MHVDYTSNSLSLFIERMGGPSNLVLLPYGSRVYGSYTRYSDYDFIGIHSHFKHGEQCQVDDKTSIQCHTPESYQNALNEHSVSVVESYLLSRPSGFSFSLHKPTLRESFSAKASNSFVKAKKKIIIPEESVEIGVKSLYHSIRILQYGIQIATTGTIHDWKSSRFTLGRIRKIANETRNREELWGILKERYQPVYNHFSTQFRLVAPK